jgi:hypothetical protein
MGSDRVTPAEAARIAATGTREHDIGSSRTRTSRQMPS